MNKPICCGKICQPVKREYGKHGYFWKSQDGIKWAAGSLVLFFKCRVCGHLGVPYSDQKPNPYMEEMESIRAEGMKFDATLSLP